MELGLGTRENIFDIDINFRYGYINISLYIDIIIIN